jgi:hypothetical protein
MSIKQLFKENPGLFILALLEGAIVMSVEIMGGNILTVFFGSSIYLWSGILGISLAGLAIGYFAGARFSLQPENKKLLFLVAVIALFTASIPVLANGVIPSLLDLDPRVGITIACIIILIPVMIGCGMISPYIIQLITKSESAAGVSAGTVYSVSTAGGILFTFLTGFVLIPDLGIRKSLFLIAFLFLLAGTAYFFLNRKNGK